jgi:hypothetical protein
MDTENNPLAGEFLAKGKEIMLAGLDLGEARQFVERVFESPLPMGVRPLAREVRIYIDRAMRSDALAVDCGQATRKFGELLRALERKVGNDSDLPNNHCA